MRLEQAQTQRQVLSQTALQSLTVLQLPLAELYPWLEEQSARNPMLDVELPEALSVSLPRSAENEEPVWRADDADFVPEQLRRRQREEAGVPEQAERSEDFRTMLRRQLLEERNIPPTLLPLCFFLVDSLNRRGYLDDSLELLSRRAGARLSDMTQALYAIQEMTPPGVGARSLQECLIIQLAQTKDFCAGTVKLIRDGLEPLARNDVRALSRLLGVSEAEARRYCDAVRRLNPIPSRGYDTGEDDAFVIPEAELLREGGQWVVRYHDRALPRVRLDAQYEAMLRQTDDPEAREYLTAQLRAAKDLMRELDERKSTVIRVIEVLVRRQSAVFTQGFTALKPLSCAEVAAELSLHPSTVSRAVQGKYLMTPVGPMELRRLFSTSASAEGGAGEAAVSSVAAKERLRGLIAAEDKAKPLSDEKLAQAMEALGVPLSRRTVAKYREAMGIPAASVRKRES